jgi:AraC family transcriptional regulator
MPAARARLIAAVGAEVVQFQEQSTLFDRVAARVLALPRGDLACMTALLFAGPASLTELVTVLQSQRTVVNDTLGRLFAAGYARRTGDTSARVELTEHARAWIDRIWGPLQTDGERLLAGHSSNELRLMQAFMARARAVQETHVRRLTAWLEAPASPAAARSFRGGLAPAALQRVQIFVEARLGQQIHVADLAARTGLSAAHFARAFKSTTGVTPRMFVEQRRVARAVRLIQRRPPTPLATIALECGFASQSQLTVAFRRQTGVTPARYRRGERGA